MSAPLEKARLQAVAGQYRAAVDSLRYAMPVAQAGDLDEARAIIMLLSDINDRADRRVKAECDEMREALQEVIARESGPDRDLEERSFVFLRGCRLITCAGITVTPDASSSWSLAFMEDRVALVPPLATTHDEVIDLGWEGLFVEVEGAGQVTSGGGFIGGGFGLEGAAVGMLTATALNALTTSSQMDTVLHLQTARAEVYLFYGQLTPVALRRTLSPVFLRLRQASASSAPASDDGGHVVDRLHKLADLLDRGLIDEGEFVRLKADLVGEVSQTTEERR